MGLRTRPVGDRSIGDRKAFASFQATNDPLIRHRDMQLTNEEKLTIGVQQPMALTRKCVEECLGFRKMVQGWRGDLRLVGSAEAHLI